MKKINLTINRGDKIAIIGENGNGKSTLLNILSGLYDINEPDKIFYNNIDLFKVNKD